MQKWPTIFITDEVENKRNDIGGKLPALYFANNENVASTYSLTSVLENRGFDEK